MTPRQENAETSSGRVTIAGAFHSQADAERAIRDLKDAGIHVSRIGVAMRDRDGPREPTEETGGILGGVVGLVAGVGALAVPGVGPIIAGGSLASALGSAGTGAGGGLTGALVVMGVSEQEARYFEKGLQQGNVLVTASAGSRGPEARGILRAYGADLGSTGRLEDEEDPSSSAGYGGHEAWRGSERRYHHDSSYAGPERRFSHR